MIRKRFPLSSDQLELLQAFANANGLLPLATAMAKDPSVISRNLQRLAETLPVLAKAGGRWHLTPLGTAINSLTRNYLEELTAMLGSQIRKTTPRREACHEKDAVLLVVNAQNALLSPVLGKRSNGEAEGNILKIMTPFRSTDRTIFHVKHVSDEPTSSFYSCSYGAQFIPTLEPRAFIGSVAVGVDNGHVIRCPWVDVSLPGYAQYHDTEWGVPIYDDLRIFEFLTLEGAQAGLSWYTILRKREAYREAFAGFDPAQVMRLTEKDIERLMANAGIVRNRAKISATIQNARAFLEVAKEFASFSTYIWRFVDGRPIQNRPRALSDYRASSPESDSMSKDLKARGFKFVGTTICYAYMQATGMVNDHAEDCFRQAIVGDLARQPRQ